MPLQPGSSLGVYSVTAKVGEGGMGEVYRARDTKLDRDVALKVLPEAFTSDPDRLARFEREAKVLASLNHPNIGGIYGLEESDGVKALVLELVEGPTLADRIAQGPIPVDEALPIAKQIAEALEAAHEAGVIHRDLKPANIKVREDGTVKVLDFGLAKALAGDAGSNPSESPTMTAAATAGGVVMGTAAYMSPEQAKGKPVDTRCDVWGFGCVLYEIVTGRRAFAGESVSETIAAVLAGDVDLDALPSDVPPAGRRLLRRCFEKAPTRRLRDLTEGLLQFEEELEGCSSGEPPVLVPTLVAPGRRALLWVAGVSVAVGLITGFATWSLTRPPSPPLVRSAVSPDDGVPLAVDGDSPDVAISPDGAHIAYLTGSVGTGAEQLHVRPLDQPTSETLVTEGSLASPFFSPDGESVGFYDRSVSPRQLKRVSVHGGAASTICDGRIPDFPEQCVGKDGL